MSIQRCCLFFWPVAWAKYALCGNPLVENSVSITFRSVSHPGSSMALNLIPQHSGRSLRLTVMRKRLLFSMPLAASANSETVRMICTVSSCLLAPHVHCASKLVSVVWSRLSLCSVGHCASKLVSRHSFRYSSSLVLPSTFLLCVLTFSLCLCIDHSKSLLPDLCLCSLFQRGLLSAVFLLGDVGLF